MHEHEHSKLDEIFREGLAQGSFPYNSDSWNKLAPELDRFATRRRWLAMRIASIVVLGLFLIAAPLLKNNIVPYLKAGYSWTSVKKVSPDNAEKPIKSQPKSTNQAATNSTEIKTTSSTNDSIATQRKVDAAPVQEKNAIRPDGRLKSSPRKTQPTQPAKEVQTIPHPSTPNHASNFIQRSTNQPSIYRSKTDTNSSTMQQDPSAPMYQEHPTESIATLSHPSNVLFPLTRSSPTLIIKHNPQYIDLNTPSVLPTSTKVQRLPGQHRFIVSLDLNSGLTTPSDFENVGTTLGLGVRAGYRIGHNTRIYVGTTWSTLHFQTEDEEAFQPPSDFWKIPGQIEYTKGTCSLLEIPVDLETSWNIGPKNYFFAGIGAASTILLKQNYIFEFEEDQPGEPLFWETTDVVKYLAGYAQVQAGVAHALGSRGTMRIAPFLQVPLTGLGVGQVRIFRFGLGLQIQPF